MSTAQASRLPTHNNIPPAMLFKEQRQPPSNIPTNPPNDAQSSSAKGNGPGRPQPRARAHSRSSNNKIQESAPSDGRKHKLSGRGSTATKRKLADSSQQPAKRRHLKEHTTRVELPANLPSPRECEGLTHQILESPKEALCNVINNNALGQLRFETVTSARGLTSSTLSYTLKTHPEGFSVVVEAANKVRSTFAVSRAC